jgi:hypothetical protein
MGKLLQEWGGVGQTLKLENVSGWEGNPVDILEHYQGQWGPWMLDSWTSDTVCKLACTSMALSLTTAPLIDNHFCVSSSRHIQKALSILLRDTLWTYTRNIHVQCKTGLNAFPEFAFIFLDKTNWFVYTKMLSNHSTSLPTYSICSLPITHTSLYLSFYLNLHVSIYILLSRHNKITRPMKRSVPSSSWCTSEPYVCSEKYKFKIINIYQHIPERPSRHKTRNKHYHLPIYLYIPQVVPSLQFLWPKCCTQFSSLTCAKCTAHFILMH